MATISNILCPIDFSACSAKALDQALTLAHAFSAQLSLVHVYEDPLAAIPFARDGITGLATAPADLIEHARGLRAAEIARLQELCRKHGVLTQVQELEGRPADVITKLARDMGADLIVMGTHGRTGFAHATAGSVAERVMRRAPCPVLTVRDTTPDEADQG